MRSLARVLKEDYKRSIELCTNIMYIWFSFSNFSQLHTVLTSRRIGNDSMKVIDLEIKKGASTRPPSAFGGRRSAVIYRSASPSAAVRRALSYGRRRHPTHPLPPSPLGGSASNSSLAA